VDERAALRRAGELAARSPRTSPNPRVGCVILDAAGAPIAEGFHRGAGLPHAEVEALVAAGAAARGATAVVTLEPCNHTGRTGPCTQALLAAGIARVVIGRRDPNPAAAGGADALRVAGVTVAFIEDEPVVADLNRLWETAVRLGRPAVIWKTAATLDGRIAAADGTSRWITGPEARREVHALRARVDAVMVGTGTALADDPRLTVRTESRDDEQPLRVVVGSRPLPDSARLLDGEARTLQIRDADPAQVLHRLWQADVRSVLLEGGPRLASAFLAADLVDEIVWFTAPALLGSGAAAATAFGVGTLADARRFTLRGARIVGGDVRIDVTREA
jgi:diaminohydroxyphosphoribosylaminopyrimidine deaminase/5-amino-6-(5-phosphoribosylamino)uracil reductase